MSPSRLGLLTVTAFLAAPLPAFAAPPGAARTDFWGDPLPVGAVARLAPTRWRVDGSTAAIRYTRDGKRVLVLTKGSSLFLHQLDAADGRHLSRTAFGSEPAFRWQSDPLTWCISPDGRLLAEKDGPQPGDTLVVRDLPTGRPVLEVASKSGSFSYVRFSPDGSLLAATEVCQTKQSAGEDERPSPAVFIRVWQVPGGKEIARLAGEEAAEAFRATVFTFAPTGKRLAAVGTEAQKEGVVRLWDLDRPAASRRLLSAPSSESLLAFSPDGKLLAVASANRVSLWDAGTTRLVSRLEPLDHGCEQLAFIGQGKHLAVLAAGTLHRYRLSSGRELPPLAEFVQGFALSADGRLLALADGVDTVRVIDQATGKECGRWNSSPQGIGGINAAVQWVTREQGAGGFLAFSPDGRTLAAITRFGVVRRWSLVTGKELPPPDGQNLPCRQLALSPDGKLLASGNLDTVNLWDVPTGKLLSRLGLPAANRPAAGDEPAVPLPCVQFSPDSRRLAAGWNEGSLGLWDVPHGKRIWAAGPLQDGIYALAFAEGGAKVLTVSGAREEEKLIWRDADTGRQTRDWKAWPGDKYGHVQALSASGAVAVTSGLHGRRVWELSTGKLRRRLDAGPDGPSQLSADGTLLLSFEDNTLALQDVATGKVLRHLQANGEVHGAAFSPDGALVAAAGTGGVQLWETATATLLASLQGHPGGTDAVVFTPDGRHLITAGQDLSVLVWDLPPLHRTARVAARDRRFALQTSRPLPAADRRDDLGRPLPRGARARLGSQRFQHGELVVGLRYLPDGKTLFSAGLSPSHESSSQYWWDARSGRQIHSAEARLTDVSCDITPEGGGLPRLGWCLSGDGRLLASADEEEKMAQAGHFLRVRELATGKMLFEAEDQAVDFYSLQLSPDGKRLAALCTGADSFRLYDLETGIELARTPVPTGYKDFRPCLLTFSPAGDHIAVLGKTEQHAPVCIYDPYSLRPPWMLPDESFCSSPVTFAPNERTLAMVSRPPNGGAARLRLWDVLSGTLLRDLGKHPEPTLALVFSRDGKVLASQQKQKVQLWDMTTGKELPAIVRKEEGYSILLSPDGQTLAVAAAGSISLYEVRSGKLRRELKTDLGARFLAPSSDTSWFYKQQQGGGLGITFSPDGKVLAAAQGQTIRRWDLASGKEIDPPANRCPVSALALSADGQRIALASGQEVLLWDAVGRVRHRLRLEAAPHKKTPGGEAPPADSLLVADLAMTPDGQRIAATLQQGEIAVWQADSKKLWQRPGSGQQPVLAFSQDGRTLLAAGQNEVLWHDALTGRQVRRLATGKPAPVNPKSEGGEDSASVGLAGDHLVVLVPKEVQLWDLAGGRRLRSLTITDENEAIFSLPCPGLKISEDGRLLVLPDDDRLHLVDAGTGKLLRTCSGLSGMADSALSPDGRLLAAAGREGVFLWDTDSGTILAQLGGHRGAATAVAFSADGRTLATGAEDSTVLLWDLPTLLYHPSAPLSAPQLAALWDRLADRDARKAHEAAATLAQNPNVALPLLCERIRPTVAPRSTQVARWIAQLESDSFVTREQAAAALGTLGEQVEGALRTALARNPSEEMRQQLTRLLARSDDPVRDREKLRGLRTVELLERLQAREARRLLEALAAGDPRARLTREASAALQRFPR